MTPQEKSKLIADIRTKLNKSQWGQYLWTFWISDEFSRIIDYLVKEVDEGKRWVPGADKMFKWMEQCPVDKIKVILLADTVFNTRESNSGILYSVDKATDLREAHKEVQDSLPGQIKYPKYKNDLSYLTNQGVLIIPTAPTVMSGKWGHHKIWSPLISYIINRINKDRSEIPWVFIGTAESHEYSDMVKSDNKYHLYTYKENKWKEMWEWVDKETSNTIKWLK